MLHWPKKSLVMPFYYINFDQNGPPQRSVWRICMCILGLKGLKAMDVLCNLKFLSVFLYASFQVAYDIYKSFDCGVCFLRRARLVFLQATLCCVHPSHSFRFFISTIRQPIQQKQRDLSNDGARRSKNRLCQWQSGGKLNTAWKSNSVLAAPFRVLM